MTMFFVLTQAMVAYHLAYMKNGGNKLAQCPDFVIHYTSIQVAKLTMPLQWELLHIHQECEHLQHYILDISI